VAIRIFNIQGRLVRELVDSPRYEAGVHRIGWDARNDFGLPVGTGVYFYRFTTKGYQDSRKVVLLR
jgi:flagellar hook assembly protein FlgD